MLDINHVWRQMRQGPVAPVVALMIVAGGMAVVPVPVTAAADQFAVGGLRSDCVSYGAVAMTPYDLSIQANLYRMTHEHVYHGTTQTGSILLYGPVLPWRMTGDGFVFSVTYTDPDGPGLASSVRGNLGHVGPAGIRIIATLDSNTQARTTGDVQVMSVPLPWSQLNDSTGYYVVRLYVERTNTAVVPSAYGYNLCSAVF